MATMVLSKQRNIPMAHKPVSTVTDINVYLNDKCSLEETSKTLAILVGSNATTVWIKHKNALAPNPDSMMQINRPAKTISVVAKYQNMVNKNRALQDLITNLCALGYTVK